MLLTSGIVVLLLAQVWNSLGSTSPTTGVEHAIGIEHAIGALAGVETRLFSDSATLDEMSAHANAHDGSPSAHAQKEAERIERLESTFQAIASGVADLESITREVEGSAELPAAVKQQVAWNLRKMTADASKLRSDALDAPQRDALRRALELRFSVLLSPAFWEQAVDRELLVS